jgi:hypothetical protein
VLGVDFGPDLTFETSSPLHASSPTTVASPRLDASTAVSSAPDTNTNFILKNLKTFKILSISKDASVEAFNAFVISAVAKMPNLKKFSMSLSDGGDIGDECFMSIVENCREIEDLCLTTLGHSLTDTVCNDFNNRVTHGGVCRALKRLQIVGENKNITSAGFSALFTCKIAATLIFVNLSRCVGVSDATILLITTTCHKLNHLDVSACKSLTNASLTTLGRVESHACRPEIISLSTNPNFTDDAMILLLEKRALAKCPITILGFLECRQLTSNLVKALAVHSPTSKEFRIKGIRDINDQTILFVSSRFSSLEFIELESHANITDESLMALALASNRTLSQLCLANCPMVTDASILSFIPKDNTFKSPVADLLKPYTVRYNSLRYKEKCKTFPKYMICPDYFDNHDSDDEDDYYDF